MIHSIGLIIIKCLRFIHCITGDLLQMLKCFLSNRKRRVVLNSQCLDQQGINTDVPRSLILDLLMLLIFINNLEKGFKSSLKLSVDKTSIFSIVKDPTKFLNELNSDLKMINNQTFQWKMYFNIYFLNQATEVRFSEKSNGQWLK